jgi:hypothetical protein
MAVAVWLVSGLARLSALRVSILLFVVFLLILSWRIFDGAASCDCFGEIQISPRLIFALDLAVIITLATEPQSQLLKTSESIQWASRGVFVWCLLVVVFFGISDEARRWGDNRPVVFLKIDELVGGQVPDIFGHEFDTGAHEVFLYREGCHACHEKYLAWNSRGAQTTERKRSVLILPANPAASAQSIAIETPPGQRLSQDERWMIEDSKVVLILDGIIMQSKGIIP